MGAKSGGYKALTSLAIRSSLGAGNFKDIEATQQAGEQATKHKFEGGMADELIPLEVREFVLTYIQSIAQLEALLLLKSKPDVVWNCANVASQLYIDEGQAKEVLDRLCEDGLVSCDADTYRFNSDAPDIGAMVERLATLYRKHLIPVTNLVHSRPSGAQAFAAAFKLRKDR